MITLIRSKIMGTHASLMWAIVIMVILSLGLPSVMQKSTSSGPWVLTINDQQVGYNSFVRQMQTQEQIARQKYGTVSPSSLQALYTQALDTLIYAELLDQAAIKAGIRMSECSAASRMADPRFIIPVLARLQALQAYSWHTGIDMRALRKILFDKGMSLADFEHEIVKMLRQEIIQQMVFVAGYSPLFERESEYKKNRLGKSFQVITLPLTQFVAREQADGVTNKELQLFFDMHKTNYSEPEKRSATVWEFTPEKWGHAPTDREIEAYYDKFKATEFVQEPVKVQVRRILLPLQSADKAQELKKDLDANPDTFAQKAQEFSQDKTSAAQGGLLQPFARGAHDAEFEKKAFALPAPGAISPIITTKDGLEIIQLVKRTDKTFKPLKTVRQEVHERLLNNRLKNLFDIESRQVTRQGDIKALDAFVQAHQGAPTAYKKVTRDAAVSPVTQRFFAMKVDEPVAFMENNKGYIVLVTAIEPSFTPALSAMADRVKKDFFEHKAAKKLGIVLQEIKQKAAKEELQALANQYKGTVSTINNVKADDSGESYKKTGMPVEKMLQLEKIGSSAVMQTPTNGYFVRLAGIEKLDAKAFDQERAALEASLRQERMQTTLIGFIASARRNATIKQNDALINMRGQ